jgi:hypothetical protein
VDCAAAGTPVIIPVVFRIRILLDPHYIGSWIRFRFRYADPDPGGVKSAKIKGKAELKKENYR